MWRRQAKPSAPPLTVNGMQALVGQVFSLPKTDFRSWIGIAAQDPPNPKPRFKSEDDLWS